MPPRLLSFADSIPEENSYFAILGVPYDRTCSFRPGTRFGPNAVRECSYNYETFMIEYGVDLADIPVFDAGDMEEFGHVDEMVKHVEEAWDSLLEKAEFPITVGGEHSITPPCVKAFAKKMRKMGKRVCVLHLDAHLDYRAEYLGFKNSHACSLRRNGEIVGAENLAAIGIRSVSSDEYMDAEKDHLFFITSFELHAFPSSLDRLYKGVLSCNPEETPIQAAVRMCLEHFRNPVLQRLHRRSKERQKKKNSAFSGDDFVIYLTLDIDAIDMAFAPGTGTPDPMGLSIWDVKYIIQEVSPYLGGFDIVEIDPLYDKNTAALGARFVREVIASVWLSKATSKHKR